MKIYIVLFSIFLAILTSCFKVQMINKQIESETNVNIKYFIRLSKNIDRSTEINYSINSVKNIDNIRVVTDTKLFIKYEVLYKKSNLGYFVITNSIGDKLTIVIDHRKLKYKQIEGELTLSLNGYKLKKNEFFYIYIDKIQRRNKEKKVLKSKFISEKKFYEIIRVVP